MFDFSDSKVSSNFFFLKLNMDCEQLEMSGKLFQVVIAL